MQVENRSVSPSPLSIGASCLLAAVTFAIGAVAPANGQRALGDPGNPPSSQTVGSRDLAAAHRIRTETTTRYTRAPGRQLAVTESSSTGVVESFTLLSGPMLDARIVPAENGIYYAICPRGAKCPFPGRRFARPATDFLSRRQALELAVRTFLETSASIVAVSLPTSRFILFIVERVELARDVDVPALARRLKGSPARAPAADLQGLVDRITRPRLFVALGLEPTPTGRDSWTGMARWPTTRRAHSFELSFEGSGSTASRRETVSFGPRNEGPFTAMAPLCSIGHGLDLELRLTAGWVTGLRRFTCADGSGSITTRKWLLGMDEASGYEQGVWKIVEGSGRYEMLRGIGTYVSVQSRAPRDPVVPTTLEAWQGVVGFDASPPRVVITNIRVLRPQKPFGSYQLRIAFTAGDDPAQSRVDFLVTARDRYLLAAKAGRSTSGTMTVKLLVRPTAGSRTIQVKLVATDQVGNERKLTRSVNLP